MTGWEGFLWVRHAETDMSGAFCGWSDPPLNGRGRRQTVELVTEMRARRLEVVYTSDLHRAAATAEAIAADHEVPVETRTGLREISFGEWEGLRWAEVEARDPVYARRWTDEYPEVPAPGGERFEVFRERVLREMAELLGAARGRKAVVVTHAGVLRVVLRAMCGVDEETAWRRTAGYCCRVEGAEVCR